MKQVADIPLRRFLVSQICMLGLIWCSAFPPYLCIPVVVLCSWLLADMIRDPDSWTKAKKPQPKEPSP